jgi:predicted nucleic acid-binding protein
VITAVDTNVLIDVLVPGSEHLSKSRDQLNQAAAEGSIVVCEAVYAELAGQFKSGGFDRFLESTEIRLLPSTTSSLQAAGNAWIEYLSSRPEGLVCPACGRRNTPSCEGCQRPLRARQHLLTDFLIGAHAAMLADRLLSRDRGHFKRYFPSLKVIDPSA